MSELPSDSAGAQGAVHVEIVPALVEGPDTRKAYKKFQDVMQAIGGLVLTLSSTGIILVVTAVLFLSEHAALKMIVAHLGVAFLGAAIVGFGIEWGGEIRNARAMTAMLAGKIHTFDKDIMRAATRDRVRSGMSDLAGHASFKFSEDSARLGEVVGHLRNQGGWAGVACNNYLLELHSHLAKGADELARLRMSGSDGFRIDLPDNRKLAEVLLQNLMQQLHQSRAGAEYSAVSDFSTWAKLSGFARQQQVANEGLKMRRVFVLGLQADQALSMEKIHQIVAEHMKMMEARPDYSIGMLMLDDYPIQQLVALNGARHFGIFKCEGQEVALLAQDDDISHLRLLVNHEEAGAEFKLIWDRSEQFRRDGGQERDANELKTDFLMAYFVHRMDGHGTYCGIAKLSDWKDGKYSHFFNSFKKRMMQTGMKARRIFVLEEESGDLRDELFEHNSLRELTGNRYEFRLCTREEAGDLFELLPLGFQKISSDEPNWVDVDLAQPNRDFIQETEAVKRRKVELFEDLWNRLQDG